MISVQTVVKDIIDNTPFIEEALAQGLINLSALARKIKPEVEEKTMKEVEIGSIIMALRRMSVNTLPNTEIKKVFSSAPDIIVRSNLFEITLANSDGLIKKQQQLLELSNSQQTYFVTITHGVFETTIIASDNASKKIVDIYKGETIIDQISNLASITVKFPLDIIEIPGVYYMILKTLAWEGIEITEVVSTYSEITVILEQKHVDRAFSLIKKLFS